MRMLEARDLSFGYSRRRVGERVNLAIEAAGVLCLLGPNGCGKTTLFRTLLGLLPPLGGDVRIAGAPVAGRSRQELASLVAYVPQAHAGLFAYTVEEVVLMGRATHVGRFGIPSARDRAIGAEMMDRVGVASLRGRPYTEISGGERQLVLIARALAQQAPLLVMDEPTASLDFGNQVRVLQHIENLRAQGLAVCLSTHQPDHALRVADKVALMQAGHLLAVGTPAEVLRPDILAKLYDVSQAEVTACLARARPAASRRDGTVCRGD